MSPPRPSWPWWRVTVTGLGALGLALSGYLGWHYVVGGSVIGCAGGSPCDQVLGSRWSAIGGVLPVSGLAAGVYLAVLVASFFLGPATEAPVRRLAWRALLVLASAAAGSAVWFIIVQKWMIGAFCPYCMSTHLTGLLLAALVIWQAPRQVDDDPTAAAPSPPAPSESPRAPTAAPALAVAPLAARPARAHLPVIGSAATGLALAGVLAACQLAFTPKGVYRAGESPRDQPAAFDPRAIPLVGSPDARHIVKVLFDYNCPHCQRLHAMLDEVVRRYGGTLAFALCPTPLGARCNPYVPADVDTFKDSCELARITLAVWVAKREAFPAFDGWMFSPEPGRLWRPRTLDAARAKAAELIGQAKLDAARNDPWIEWYLQASIRLYGDNGAEAVPKLVFGPHWVTPQPSDTDDLVSILQDSLALPKP